MLARAATLLLLAAALAPPAGAEPVELVPGVTYERTVEFTPQGVVVLHVITAPRPGTGNGLYDLAPVLAGGTIAAPAEPLTRIERDVSATSTVVGINGDFFAARDAQPAGIVMAGGAVQHPPLGGRSSIGVDAAGTLHVDRVRLFGTWQGRGQRRTLNTVNKPPAPGQVALFTPAYGGPVPTLAGSAEIVLASFPSPVPNTDLRVSVAATGTGGGEAVPPGGAVIQAAGGAAAKLAADAPAGTSVVVRLGLQPAWTGTVSALGGGPVLVRDGKPVFQALEDFTSQQVTARSARAAVGQLADGRVVLVAVDGGQPGYSAGLTSYELAKALVERGVVSAAGVQPGATAAAAFDGTLLSRPSAGREQAVKEALLVEYAGVYAPPLPLPLVNGEPARAAEPLTYRLVRPSTVTAQLVAPDGTPRPVESAVQRAPGTYTQSVSSFDAEGTWHWNVTAVDDLGRPSTADLTFRYDLTLTALTAPKTAHRSATVRFTLSRPALVRVAIETKTGVLVRALPAASLAAGPQSVVWDGRLPRGTPAYAGSYVAHVTVTSAVGTSDLSVPFGFRRS
jgi:hypothetical protein